MERYHLCGRRFLVKSARQNQRLVATGCNGSRTTLAQGADERGCIERVRFPYDEHLNGGDRKSCVVSSNPSSPSDGFSVSLVISPSHLFALSLSLFLNLSPLRRLFRSLSLPAVSRQLPTPSTRLCPSESLASTLRLSHRLAEPHSSPSPSSPDSLVVSPPCPLRNGTKEN